MMPYRAILLVTTLSFAGLGPARADDSEAKAILDKAIKALGGEEKLTKAGVHSWKYKGKRHAEQPEQECQVTANGLDHFRREFNRREANLPQLSLILVIAGDKGWQKNNKGLTELDAAALARFKQAFYLQAIPITLMPLREKGFELEAAGAEKVGDKPAVVLKVTTPDGKDFTLFFDKESGLPVKEVATMTSAAGRENSVESTFLDYKDMGGIKKATRIEMKFNGEPSFDMEITEFKVLDKVDPETFTEPK
jgi:hypothetical protein